MKASMSRRAAAVADAMVVEIIVGSVWCSMAVLALEPKEQAPAWGRLRAWMDEAIRAANRYRLRADG